MKLPNEFHSRDDLIAHVSSIAPWAKGNASHIIGGMTAAKNRLEQLDPIAYAITRNFGNGSVSHLSPYINHGIISLNEVRNYALSLCDDPKQATKLIQELTWRDFWQYLAKNHPNWLWDDVEPYKTGWSTSDYSNSLPKDIETGQTGVACIDNFIAQLLNDGYVHNHARMYIASYVVHFRQVRWQAGAEWFLAHLLDGNEASNNFSWQWVASTLSQKPYIFNLDNVQKYFDGLVNTDPKCNAILADSYESISLRLFPHLEAL
ncbi:MAG: FAD-binding domain-containing protein [Candidatus Comchoanobacterales bacterium]